MFALVRKQPTRLRGLRSRIPCRFPTDQRDLELGLRKFTLPPQNLPSIARLRHQDLAVGGGLRGVPGMYILAVYRKLVGIFLHRYRPELHYMRGPGPKWIERQGRRSTMRG